MTEDYFTKKARLDAQNKMTTPYRNLPPKVGQKVSVSLGYGRWVDGEIVEVDLSNVIIRPDTSLYIKYIQPKSEQGQTWLIKDDGQRPIVFNQQPQSQTATKEQAKDKIWEAVQAAGKK